MTSAQLYDGILNEFNMMRSSKRKNIALFGERSVKLIEQAKEEWCFKQRENCAEMYHSKNIPFTDDELFYSNRILNAPKP